MTQLDGGRRTAALILLCLGQLMCILDISIVNIALPSIQKELNLGTWALQWVVTAYVLAYGGFLLVGGRLGDIFGRRRLLFIGLTIFTLASALGGLSTDAAMLLGARAGQGLGGAIITPTVMSFIAGLYPEGAERNQALGILGAVTGLGFAFGLVLGGFLTNTVGWRWVFFINLPIGIFIIVSALWLLPATERLRQPVDLPGAVLATAGLSVATYTLSTIDRYGFFSWHTFIMAAIVALIFYVLRLVERRSPHPLVPPGLLGHNSLVRAVIGSSVFGAIIGPTTFMLTLYLQNNSGFNPLKTGLSYLPQEATVLLAANLAGRLVTRFDTKRVLAVGVTTMGTAALWLTRLPLGGEGYTSVVLPGLLVMGLGLGAVSVAGSIAATEGVPQAQHGVAAGIWNTGTQIGTAMGLALLTSTASARTAAIRAAMPGITEQAAVTAGYQAAFFVGAAIGLAGLISLYQSERARLLVGRLHGYLKPAGRREH